MNNFLSIFLTFFSFIAYGQAKISFEYNPIGSRVLRKSCLNCITAKKDPLDSIGGLQHSFTQNSDTNQVRIQSIVANKALPNGVSISIGPNPTYNDLKVVVNGFEGETFVQLVDQSGKEILKRTKLQESYLDVFLTNHLNGVYLLNLWLHDVRYQFQIVKL